MPHEPDTVPVEYRVVGVEPVRGSGRLVALAIIELDVAGVAIVQGVQIRRSPDGRLNCLALTWRNPRTGQSIPAVLLPLEFAAALGNEVLAAMGADG
jgi:hypothetical protein